MNEQGAKNTDIEIWRKIPDDFYSPSIRVTENSDIRICVGGYVLTAPIEQWFAAGEVAFCVEERPNEADAQQPLPQRDTGEGWGPLGNRQGLL